MREVDLPSGAKLKISMAPFAESKALFKAVLEEAKSIGIDAQKDITDINMYKEIFCAGFSSKKIDDCLKPCLGRCTYNDSKITDDTFESAGSREDYLIVCYEVAVDNISPFLKSLYAKFSQTLENLKAHVPA